MGRGDQGCKGEARQSLPLRKREDIADIWKERRREGAARGQWRLLDIPLGLAGAGVFRSFSAKPPVTPVDIDCKPPLEKEKGSGRESGKRSRLLARGPAVLWKSAGRKGWFSAHFSLRFHLPWVGPSLPPELTPGVSVKRGWRGWGRCSSAGGHKRGGSNAAEKG